MNNEANEKEKNEQPEGENPEQTMVALTFDEYDALEKQIEDLQKEAEETKDSWLRSRADFDNYKKRVQRDAERSYQDALANVIKIFLGASDDLERALNHRPESEEVAGWVNGIELIQQKLVNQMKQKGVEQMEIKPGDEFNPNFHEAVTQEDNPDYADGQIIEVVQPGYRIADRVIRPAMVRVAK
jgi:molecular chaperone GrpE